MAKIKTILLLFTFFLLLSTSVLSGSSVNFTVTNVGYLDCTVLNGLNCDVLSTSHSVTTYTKIGYADLTGTGGDTNYRTYYQFDISSLGEIDKLTNAYLNLKRLTGNGDIINTHTLEHIYWDGVISSDDWGHTWYDNNVDTLLTTTTSGVWSYPNITSVIQNSLDTTGNDTISFMIKLTTEKNVTDDGHQYAYINGNDTIITINYLEYPDIVYTKIDTTQPLTDTTATLKSPVYFRDYEDVTAYYVLNGVNQSRTSYNNNTLGTSYFYHYENFTGLDGDTLYEFELCIEYDTDITECNNGYSTTETNFTTLKTIPYINIHASFDINQTAASLGGTFFYEDYGTIDAYFTLDGVNQTVTEYISGGASQYHTEDFTGLTYNTTYDYEMCLYYNDTSTICDSGNFTTLDYTPPSINVISAFNITNHEATLGTTVLYNDYNTFTLSWYLDSVIVSSLVWEQEDEYDTSAYYTFNVTELDYLTEYDYELEVRYLNHDYTLQNVTTCENMTQVYGCDGSRTNTYGYTWDTDNTYYENTEVCNSLCEQDEENLCCMLANGFCYAYDGVVVAGDTSSFASTCNNTEEQSGTIKYINDSDNFTTLDAYIPYFTISSVNIGSTTATLTSTHYNEDYNSTVPFFRLNGVDLYPKYNYSSGYPLTETYNLVNLSTNTTYNYTACVGYGLGWASIVCDTTKTFTTGNQPIITLSHETEVETDSAKLVFDIDYAGTTNVYYSLYGNTSYTSAIDGTNSYLLEDLTTRTNYTYFFTVKYDTLGNTHYLNSSERTFTTYYDNAFDDVWDNMLQGSSIAKILLGFVVLLGIIFLGVGAFGKYGLQIGMVGILFLTIIGTVFATLMKLFPVYILLLVIVGSILLMIMKNMFFNNEVR